MKTFLTAHLLLIIFLLIPAITNAQLVSVSGKVFVKNNGKTLKGVSVFESTTNTGTITNEKGYFKLVLPKGKREIIISESGFKKYTQQIILQKDTIITVKLKSFMKIKKPKKVLAIKNS